MSFREYLGIGGEDRPQQTCDWCGREIVSFWWSGSEGRYCSFKCSAAGSYHRYILLTASVITITVVFFSIIIMFSLKSPIISPFFVILMMMAFTPIAVFDISLLYTLYVGRYLRKDK